MNEIEIAWLSHRRRVFDVGYRMTGSVSDADDVVQETYVRLLKHGVDDVLDLEAWLVTVAARVCLDRLRATARHDGYIGPWLPEPIVTTSLPEDRVTLDDSVRLALLMVLEQLSPAERTSFLLHDVFGLPFEEIAAVVGRTEAACRQLASRARRHIAAERTEPKKRVERAELERVAARFAAASAAGSFDELVAVLDPDVTGDFDSGGVIPGAPYDALHGSANVASQLVRSFVGVDASFQVAAVNGDPGVVVAVAGQVVAVIVLDSDHGLVREIHAIGNPAKLTHVTI